MSPQENPRTLHRREGYTLIILMVTIAIMSIGLLVAIPVWKTQIQREKEEELIFRGRQYVEAVRLYQTKYPGRFPQSLEELMEERCIRKLYSDPMTGDGIWNVILHHGGTALQKKGVVRKILIAPQAVLSSIDNPQILGVVSASTKKSIKIYQGQETYDKWLFFYGQESQRLPEIVYYSLPEKE
ncbi:MAG: type II secretion system protein [Candidatus Aminicenantales bacterium]